MKAKPIIVTLIPDKGDSTVPVSTINFTDVENTLLHSLTFTDCKKNT